MLYVGYEQRLQAATPVGQVGTRSRQMRALIIIGKSSIHAVT
jgi:hypothetical protein